MPGLDHLSDDDLLERYRAVDGGIEGDDPDARAIELDAIAAETLRRRPDSGSFWYDRGMYAKWRRDWAASVEYNRRSLELLPPGEREGDPTCWNLGIAATGLRDLTAARAAWAAFGIPEHEDYGVAPVRLNAGPRHVGQQAVLVDDREHETEVVWGLRLCPARIRIFSVPTPESGHRCGDVVLHDGEPVGTRRLDDEDVAVFDELELWERSPTPTLTVQVRAPDAAAVEELVEAVEHAGGTAEDWTANLEVRCRACSEGTGTHDHASTADRWTPGRTLGISAEPELAHAVLSRWSGGRFTRRSYRGLTLALA